MNEFQPLEIVGSGSETQSEVGENLGQIRGIVKLRKIQKSEKNSDWSYTPPTHNPIQ